MSLFDNKKCSHKGHNNLISQSYCPQCKEYMCEECENSHSNLQKTHNPIKLDQSQSQDFQKFQGIQNNRIMSNLTEIFTQYTGTCNEQNHFNGPLDYFCKTHNKMVCGYCICKINANNHGCHKDCDVCCIKNIEPIKKNNLQNLLMTLQGYLDNINDNDNDKQNVLKKANNNIVMMKDNVRKTFADLREQLDNREKEILQELDEKYRELVAKANQDKDEEILKENIQTGIDCGRKTEGEWSMNNSSQAVQRCLDLENYVGKLKESVITRQRNKKPLTFDVNFFIEEVPKSNLIRSIQSLGLNSSKSISITEKKNCFRFRECPYEAIPEKKYTLNESHTVATKVGTISRWTGIICDKILEPNKIYKWKIKILKSINGNIMLGVINLSNYDVNNKDFDRAGWCIDLNNASLYSGSPHNYAGNATQFRGYNDFKNKTREVSMIMDTYKGNLTYNIEEKSLAPSYIGIPVEERLVPFVALNVVGDSIEIMEDDD